MASMGITVVILVLVFFVGVPLFMLTAFLLCHYCGQQSDSQIPRRYGSNFGQDSDEENSQSHVRESVHLSTSFNHNQHQHQHQHQNQPPSPSIPIQDNTIEVHIIPPIVGTGLDQSVIESLPTGPIGEKVLIENPGLECSICLAEYCVDDIVRRLPCTHAFHLHCIDQWLTDNLVCPICKNNLKHLLHPSP